MHMFTWGSLGKEVRVTPPNDDTYTNKSTQSIWKTKGLCGLCRGQMKRGGNGGWTSNQADKNSGVFCNPNTWQQLDMALTVKISPGFAQQW